MHKRERLERTLAGEPTDRAPVAAWRHFPGDDQRSADLARATIEFQQAYDWDFIKFMPANTYAMIDYGAQDAWMGGADGERTITKRVVERSLDWTALRTLDPTRGALGKQTEALMLVCDVFGDTVPTLHTLYSPLAQAELLAGDKALIRHLRTHPDRVHTGLNMLTETTLRLIDSLRRLPLAGVVYVIRHANYALLSEDEYRAFGLPYDRRILDSLPSKWWFNMVSLDGSLPMFKCAGELPVHAIHWEDRSGDPALTDARLLFHGALCGGVAASTHMQLGTPTVVREAAREALLQMNQRRLILAPGSSAAVTTPFSNWRALREAAEGG